MPLPTLMTAHALRRAAKQFLADMSGAVTVDWIVLTAALVAMVVAFMAGFTADVDGFLVSLMASL